MATARTRLNDPRDLRLVTAGQGVSMLGTAISDLALPIVAVDLLGATSFGTGMLGAASTAAYLVIGLQAGVWIDRLPRRPFLLLSDAVRAALPMLPAARRERLAASTGADASGEAVVSVVERGQDDYVLAVGTAGGDIGRALVHVKEAFAEQPASPGLPAADLAALTRMEVAGSITATQAKAVLADLLAAGGGDPVVIAAARGFEAMDTGALDAIVDQAIAADPDAWAKFCAGEGRAMGALVGFVMKATQGKADGKEIGRAHV